MLRVRVRSPQPDDEAALRLWLAEAVAAVQGRDAVPEPGLTLAAAIDRWDAVLPAGQVWLALLPDGSPVGLARVRRSNGGPLIVDALAVRRDARNLGYGQEFVIALEQGHGTTLSFAGVPRTNGLAVYFWLRAGYRPSFPPLGDEPAVPEGRLWMRRASAPADISGTRARSNIEALVLSD